MPAKKTVAKSTKSVKQVSDEIGELEDSSSSEHFVQDEVKPSEVAIKQPGKTMYLSNSLKSTDSDRIQLAHAINNFTIKSEQFIQEMKNFDTFKESVLKLDILIDSKKQEYNKINEALESEYVTKKKHLENQHAEMTKKHMIDHADKMKKCENEFADKNKVLTNTYEDESIQMKRKLDVDKTKTCNDFAKALSMKFIKESEHKELLDNVQKAVQDYTDLKKTFDKQCNQIKEDEKVKYQNQLKSDTLTMDLTHKANNAKLVAQVEQQQKEIAVLNSTIENLKSEMKEQRELTKQVAQASSKSQINQTIGKS